MRRPEAERRACGCKVWKTRAPRCLSHSWRAGMLILQLICRHCERRWRRIIVN